MRILVVGGTGFIGQHLCRELHERGHEVTAMSRDPGEATLPAGVETAMGDVTAYDSIEGAFEGQDAAINLVALSPLFKPSGGDDRHFEVHRDGTANVVRAAEAHDVPRLVQMSALGADPDGETAYIRSKGLAEAAVRDADLEWVVFRPSVVFGDGGEFVEFTKKLATPYLTPLPGGGKTRFQPLWVGDVVPMLADALEGTVSGGDGDEGETGAEGDPHVGQIYEIGGPEVLTLAEVARLAHAADGKPVDVVPIPMFLAKVGLSLADHLPGAPMGSDQYRSLQFDNTTTGNDVGAFGVDESELTTLASYLGVDPDETAG
ncbi:complex I NDUFA9 subunit family protein [Natronomonas salina]|uniref:complex I NDUFA9 subunit family protein n=1 Tax=Natronomonas salina TaxID=1710540 RepID=UPI0015B66242|nr:complex I NDUFA9 subunit family protein [Natronomonas salina]QLD90463.1 complex I NDUFA9 subunit family protein [Natronomonas salina]